jgi:hypothetical protein
MARAFFLGVSAMAYISKADYGIMARKPANYSKCHKALAMVYCIALLAGTALLALSFNAAMNEAAGTVRNVVHSLQMARGGGHGGGHGHHAKGYGIG